MRLPFTENTLVYILSFFVLTLACIFAYVAADAWGFTHEMGVFERVGLGFVVILIAIIVISFVAAVLYSIFTISAILVYYGGLFFDRNKPKKRK